MSGNELKNPVYKTVSDAVQNKIVDAIQKTGKGLPCHVTKVSGALITVQFDVNSIFTLPQVTVPLFGPEYIRYPIKQGDLGVVIALDLSVSYTSGQGGGIPNLSTYSPPANLEALVFLPIGNKNWVAVDSTAVTIYAPNGVTMRDTNSGDVMILHPSQFTITIGSTVFQMDANSITCTTQTFTVNAPTIFLNGQLAQGNGSTHYACTLQGPVTVINDVTAAGKSLDTHVHSGVQSGSGNSGPPV